MGNAAWAIGGVGSCGIDGRFAVERNAAEGAAIRDCNDRQVVTMLPRVVAEEIVGGLAGGEKKLDSCASGGGGAESQERAEGRSIVRKVSWRQGANCRSFGSLVGARPRVAEL